MKMNNILIILSVMSTLGLKAFAEVLPDLEEMSQEFVLESKKIDIPEFPFAFNPSMIRCNGSILMSFRLGSYPNCSSTEEGLSCRIPSNRVTTEVGLVLLDEQFNVISKPQILNIPNYDPSILFYPQDPRLVNVSGQIYAVYNNYVKIDSVPMNRMYFSKLYFDGVHFVIGESECITEFDKCTVKKTEKNWAPFDFGGELFFEYSLFPHKVFQTLPGSSVCNTVGLSQGDIHWHWGQLRGGTPAIQIGDEYLGFFHCSKDLKTTHSMGKKITHYFMGAYTFKPNSPFSLTKISPEPIIGKGFYERQKYATWKPLLGVFPSGYIFDDQFIWVSYGKQDHEVWVVKLDKIGLLNSLKSVSTVEN